MGSPECYWQRCGFDDVEAFRHQPRPGGGTSTQLRVGTCEIKTCDLLADPPIFHAPSNRDDFASGSKSDDRSRMGWWRGGAIDQVAAFDGGSYK